MNKSKIEWCDRTWNPVTGCLHGCEYCYARRIARRFCTNEFGKNGGLLAPCNGECKACSEMDGMEFVGDEIRYSHGKNEGPYPYEFDPTFHRYRLDEPQAVRKPQNIFVCSMADLFGEWVPDEWIQAVFDACAKAPQHNYLFLTKNPGRYEQFNRYMPGNMWFGWTQTRPEEVPHFDVHHSWNTFISLEPLREELTQFYPNFIDWAIIGAQTGPGSKDHQPKREWIHDIVKQCRAANVPVFMKNSLADIWGEPLIQEWPEGLRG